jgi:Mrp family chromosome partitioning ATPase
MIPRVATVLSAREWESELVALARDTASVRLVLRAYQPDDIESQANNIDVVVAGAETSWVTPAQVASWRRAGLLVVGVYPSGDRPAAELLESGGAHETISDDVPVSSILQLLRLLPSVGERVSEDAEGHIVAVVGARGAPGRTEIALALAWNWAAQTRTLLLDLDLEAPSLAIRVGRPPRPDVADVADGVRSSGVLAEDDVQRFGPISLVVGSHRPGEPLLRSTLVEDVVEAAVATYATVVVDTGPAQEDDRILKRSDHAVLVAEGSATGLVRASRLVANWAGPPPVLLLNRVPRGKVEDVVVAARRWTGLEPSVFIADRRRIREAAASAAPPDWSLRKALAPLGVGT